MQVLPHSPKKKARLIRFLAVFTVLLLGYFFIQKWFTRKLPNQNLTTSSSLPTALLKLPEEQLPPCPQQTTTDGYQIQNNQLSVNPRCLTVLNARFGSRFNLDWYFGRQKTKSGLLGNMQDNEANLSIQIKKDDKTTQLWPAITNGPNPKTTVNLGLTFQNTVFTLNDFILSLKTNSPFSPSSSLTDENVKMSAAPFFYLDLTFSNPTGQTTTQTITLTMGGFDKVEQKDGYKIVYLTDSSVFGGRRALAVPDSNKNIDFFAYKKSGGFQWQAVIPPYSSLSTTLVYAGYTNNQIMADTSQPEAKNLVFAYTNWFKNIDEVVLYAINNQSKFNQLTTIFENTFNQSFFTAEEKWLSSQAFHSYLANSWLVSDQLDPKYFAYYVWEGEFKFINTLDVAHDYAVLEGLYFPWVLPMTLDSWQKNNKTDEAGIVIPHDLGQRFDITGIQAYRIDRWQTSGMPVEENANFIILAYWYWHQTHDDKYLKKLGPIIHDLVSSLASRDTNHNGIADQYIGMTTYDSDSNSALKEAPDSTYLGLKQLTAYVFAEKILNMGGLNNSANTAKQQAALITQNLKNTYRENGYFPLSLGPDFVEKNQFDGQTIRANQEQGFAFISGLFYAALTNVDSPYLAELIPLLQQAYPQAYDKCLTRDNGKITGLQLTEYNFLHLGWFSHSMIADYTAAQMFGQTYRSNRIFFPYIYDNPYGFTDGFYFREPFYPPQTALHYYPRGVTIFSFLMKN